MDAAVLGVAQDAADAINAGGVLHPQAHVAGEAAVNITRARQNTGHSAHAKGEVRRDVRHRALRHRAANAPYAAAYLGKEGPDITAAFNRRVPDVDILRQSAAAAGADKAAVLCDARAHKLQVFNDQVFDDSARAKSVEHRRLRDFVQSDAVQRLSGAVQLAGEVACGEQIAPASVDPDGRLRQRREVDVLGQNVVPVHVVVDAGPAVRFAALTVDLAPEVDVFGGIVRRDRVPVRAGGVGEGLHRVAAQILAGVPLRHADVQQHVVKPVVRVLRAVNMTVAAAVERQAGGLDLGADVLEHHVVDGDVAVVPEAQDDKAAAVVVSVLRRVISVICGPAVLDQNGRLADGLRGKRQELLISGHAVMEPQSGIEALGYPLVNLKGVAGQRVVLPRGISEHLIADDLRLQGCQIRRIIIRRDKVGISVVAGLS